jgi:hypothetical protein
VSPRDIVGIDIRNGLVSTIDVVVVVVAHAHILPHPPRVATPLERLLKRFFLSTGLDILPTHGTMVS